MQKLPICHKLFRCTTEKLKLTGVLVCHRFEKSFSLFVTLLGGLLAAELCAHVYSQKSMSIFTVSLINTWIFHINKWNR